MFKDKKLYIKYVKLSAEKQKELYKYYEDCYNRQVILQLLVAMDVIDKINDKTSNSCSFHPSFIGMLDL
jgi:hypothetical protein